MTVASITSASSLKAQLREPMIGIAWMCFAVLIFTGMDAMAKWQTERYHVAQLIFFRAVFGTIVLLPFLLKGGMMRKLRTRRPGLHFVRGFIGCISLVCYFLAYQYLELADAIALSFCSPLFMTALSALFLGERVGWRRWSAVAVGFLGVLVMVQPGGELFTMLALLPLLGAFTYALVGVTIRTLSTTEEPVTIVFFFGVFSAILSAIALPFVWITPMSVEDWIGQISIGLIGGIAQLAMTTAFRMAPVSTVAPFEYSGIIWAVLLGYWIWGDLPGSSTWAGAVLVVGSGLYIVHREASQARSANREAARAAARPA